MASPGEDEAESISPESIDSEEEENDDEEEEGAEDEEEEGSGISGDDQREKLNKLVRRLSRDRVKIRVHDIVIKGTTKTRDSLIEAEVQILRNVSTMQELLQAASVANARLQRLNIFESVSITLDAGPPELPDTANVVIHVRETKNPLTGDIGIFSKPEARSWSIEGSLKLKNLLGYGDIWDGSGAYGWDQTSEISAGVSLPRLKGLSTPLVARISLLSQDWLKFSSYKERLLGLSVGLVSTKHHDLAYNLTWRTLTDPSHTASKSIRRQLGHSLLSSIKYTYKIDRRDSPLRPMRGYAFVSTSQVGGLVPDGRSLRFVRQLMELGEARRVIPLLDSSPKSKSVCLENICEELDLRYALPLGFYNTSLNLGISGGIILPWGRGFSDLPSPIPERFFIGGHSSPVCSLNGPTTLLGFRSRGLGPTAPRRVPSVNQSENEEAASGRDVLGGDLAVTAFADLSFDLPLKLFRDSGIHGHLFACTGNLIKLTENEIQGFMLRKFGESFRSSAGFGIIIPTKLFRVEINYCYILKQLDHDRGKTGIQFNFSSP